jgi:predicted acyl esterase
MRGRYRRGWEVPSPIPANRVTQFTVDLHQQAYTFRRGHRIMVQVQSTWFPLIDRNPQKYVPNIFEAKDSDFQSAEQRVYRSEKWPSRVEMQVMK